MNRRQVQFETPDDLDWVVAKHVTWNAVKVIFFVLISLAALAGIEYVRLNGPEIDKTGTHINHLIR